MIKGNGYCDESISNFLRVINSHPGKIPIYKKKKKLNILDITSWNNFRINEN